MMWPRGRGRACRGERGDVALHVATHHVSPCLREQNNPGEVPNPMLLLGFVSGGVSYHGKVLSCAFLSNLCEIVRIPGLPIQPCQTHSVQLQGLSEAYLSNARLSGPRLSGPRLSNPKSVPCADQNSHGRKCFRGPPWAVTAQGISGVITAHAGRAVSTALTPYYGA